MAFRGIYIKLPEEAIELLDALAPHVGEVHPARVGRTSVILSMMRGDNLKRKVSGDPQAERALERVAGLLDRSRL